MIAIYEDAGAEYSPEDYEPTAVYDGEWIVDINGWSDIYEEGTPEDAIAQQLDGPSAVAVEVTERPDELIETVRSSGEFDSKAYSSTASPADVVDFDVYPESEEQTREEERAEEEREREKNVSPVQSTILGVGDNVEIVDEEEEEPDEKAEGRVYVDSVHHAPDDKVVHAEVDHEGDTQELYYEP